MTSASEDDVGGERLRRVLGVRSVRLDVLRAVVAADEVSAGDLMAALELTRNGVRRHVRELEREGLLVSAIVRRGSTRSVRVWRPQRSEVTSFIDDLDLYVMGR